jgi:predicted O-linked N-acetylglucosamine transferase (SPINDLY family)
VTLSWKPDEQSRIACAHLANLFQDRWHRCKQESMASISQTVGEEWRRAIGLHKAGRLAEATAAYRKLLSRAPRAARLHVLLAGVLLQAGELADAERHYRRALDLDPADRAARLHDLGVVLVRRRALDEAAACFGEAASLDPQLVEAHYHLGNVELLRNRIPHAMAAYRRVLALVPEHEAALAELAYYLRDMADWHDLAMIDAGLDRGTWAALAAGRRPHEMPFASLLRTTDPALHRDIARAWAKRIAADAGPPLLPAPAEPTPGAPLRLGYITGEFRDHPTIHLLRHLLPWHDPARFEVTVYAYGKGGDSPYRAEALAAVPRFVDIDALSPAKAASRIRADGIQVLIELTGYIRHNRLGIGALRPAPVQAVWLGYPGTTGASWLDYVITDATLLPPGDEPFYSETPARLPDSFMALGPEPEEPVPGRAELGLPEDGMVFCSFNAVRKLDPVLFACWMRILGEVPGSVLWLANQQPLVEHNLRATAVAAGIDPARLAFARGIDYRANLARLGRADLALDTVRYNGGITTANLLWAGVPVLTIEGGYAAARMSASLLRAVGLPELIMPDLAAYEAKAKALGRMPDQLRTWRAHLLGPGRQAPLFDPARLARALETLLQAMWERHCSGLPPVPLSC